MPAVEQSLDRKRFLLYQLPYLLLYAVAIVLVAMTAHNAAEMNGYWQMFIPLVALVSILGGWRWAEPTSGAKWVYVLRQVLHWGAVVLVIQLLFAHAVQDFLNDEQDAFVSIYLVGLAAILSGLYLDWKMALFGIFLVLSGVGLAWLNDNYMLLLVVVGGGGLLAIVVSLTIRGRLLKLRGADAD